MINAGSGLERVISIFEDGWISGVNREGACPPSHVDASLQNYWLDGYETGITDSQNRDYLGSALCGRR